MSDESPNLQTTASVPLNRESAQALVDKILSRQDGRFSARKVLDEHSELEQFASCVIDLAYEEFFRAREQGDTLQASEFVREFSNVEQSLYRIIEFDQVLHDHPSLVEEVPNERWPTAGQTFQNFMLLTPLGRGALSRVFLARHKLLGQKPVVVKICVRGEREAELLGRLEHPGIGEVHSIDTDQSTGLAAICMPYQTRATMHHVAEWLESDGQPLAKTEVVARDISQHVHLETSLTLQAESDSPAEELKLAAGYFEDDSFDQVVAKWSVDLSDALHHAHQNGVLHCDVKPGNVLILPDLSVRLMDFNLANRNDEKTNLAGGTLPYMAPEQLRIIAESDSGGTFRDELLADLDGRTDVFGLCATLWHFATGSPPFGSAPDCETRREAAQEILKDQRAGLDREKIAEAKKVLSNSIVETLLSGMALAKADRPASAEELQREFRKSVKVRRRGRSWSVAAGTILLAAVVSLVVSQYADPSLAALKESRTLFAAGDTREAYEVLADYKHATPESQFVELAARTASIDPPIYNQQTQERALIQSWQEIRSEWLTLATATQFSAEAYYNMYLVDLELRDHEAACESLELARDAGLADKACGRAIALCQLRKEPIQHPTDFETFESMADSIQEGSRGEYFMLFRAAHLAWKLDPHPDTNPRLKKVLDSLLYNLVSPSPVAEPRAYALYRHCANLTNENFDVFRELRFDHSTRAPKRLHLFLKLPASETD